jgi:hypothetical protein
VAFSGFSLFEIFESSAAATQRQIDRRGQREAAEQRASALLLQYLSHEQGQQWRKYGRFDLVGSLGGNYRIANGRVNNIALMRDGKMVTTLCAGPNLDVQGEILPTSDVVLGQYLALVTDEAGFLAIANSERSVWETWEVSCSCPMCRSLQHSWNQAP